MVLLSADLESDASGGIRTYVRDLVKHAPPDFEIEVVGSTAEPTTRPVGSWRSLTFGDRQCRYLPIVHIPPNASSRVPDLLRYVGALLLRGRALGSGERLVEIHRPAIALAFLRRRRPMIQWLHLNTIDGVGQLRWRRAPGLFRLVEAVTLRRMARIYLPSRPSVEDLQRRYPKLAGRVRFSPNWFDAQRFRPPTDAERREAREWLAAEAGFSATADTAIVLFVGRLEAVKDPRLLLAAFAEHLRTGRGSHLVMIGDGSLRQRIDEWSGELALGGRVHLLGARPPDDVARAMHAADVLLMASRSEASARVALEALGAGLPVVSTRAGEMEAVVSHAATGWLAADRSPRELAAGLAWALAQPRDEMTQRASASVAEYVPDRALAPLYDDHRRLYAQVVA